MTKAIRFHTTGGPEVLAWEDVQVPAPGRGEVRLRHTAVGLNFIDTYHRSGLYKLPLPAGLGQEGAGVVEAVGADVEFIQIGDRVAYCGAGAPGAYAEVRNAPAERMVPLPADIDDQAAAAMLLKGLTAWYLLRRTYVVQPGDTILVHSAAGGVGLILCQWAAHLGATVIGTVGSRAKAELAAAHGCRHPLVLGEDDFVARVKELTGGKGVPAVYDSVGMTTFLGSLDCLRPRGLMVSFGQSSGAVPPLDVTLLAAKGSLFLTRPSLFAYVAERSDLLAAAAELFALVRVGVLRIEINQTYPLKDAAQAHRDLEGRRTTGSTVLIP
jgi:NADPH2:quinone reductase